MTTIVHLDFPGDDTKALITVEGHNDGGILLHDEARYPGEETGWSVEDDCGYVIASRITQTEAVHRFLRDLGIKGLVDIREHHEWKSAA